MPSSGSRDRSRRSAQRRVLRRPEEEPPSGFLDEVVRRVEALKKAWLPPRHAARIAAIDLAVVAAPALRGDHRPSGRSRHVDQRHDLLVRMLEDERVGGLRIAEAMESRCAEVLLVLGATLPGSGNRR
jgi:hypothetical protein